jgi:hypothetical protein
MAQDKPYQTPTQDAPPSSQAAQKKKLSESAVKPKLT